METLAVTGAEAGTGTGTDADVGADAGAIAESGWLRCGRFADGVVPDAERAAWMRRLPRWIDGLVVRWSIAALAPLANDGSGSWIAAATLADGRRAVLKLGFPHFEGRDEIDGLRFWSEGPVVRLLAAERRSNAMLLERCVPGSALSRLPEPLQDEVLGGLLQRLRRPPPASHPFRPLAELSGRWHRETRDALSTGGRDALVESGLAALETLGMAHPSDVVLATDLHAGNVLSAAPEPWLVIDPKPFVGDPAFDVTQHLLNCPERLRADPLGLIGRVAGLAGVERMRVRRWLFARLVAEPGRLDAKARAVARVVDPEPDA